MNRAWLTVLCLLTLASAAPAADIQLSLLGRYQTGIFDEGAAEIVAHDPASQRLFVVNGGDETIDVLGIADPTNPVLLFQISVAGLGSPNSVAVAGGVVAVAVEAPVTTDSGVVAFFDTDGTPLGTVPVGALPDMLTFTLDGSRVLVACEGEPGAIDPPGTVAVVDISGGVGSAIVTLAGFGAFDGREEDLRADGVRIFPGVAASLDFEPEFIAISPDGATAFVTLQEANAFGVLDIATATFTAVLPLGLKDHAGSRLKVGNYPFPAALPVLGTTATVNPANPAETTAGQDIFLGGLSALWFEGIDGVTGNYQFVTVPDRGPNGEPTDVDGDLMTERPFALPDYQARIIRFELNPVSGEITLTGEILLTRADGSTPITGLPNIPGVDEEPVDLWGNVLAYDELGADLEGVVIASDGTYWMCDEYRPAIYHFDAAGVLMARFVPEGTGALAGQPAGTFGDETLPSDYSSRRANRGFEAIALDPETGVVYAWIQTPLANPSTAVSNASSVIRVLGIDPLTGEPVSEWVYLLEKPEHRLSTVDKIGDAVAAGNGIFYVVERDSAVVAESKKLLFRMDARYATNLRAPGAPMLPVGETLEQQTPDDLVALGIRAADKIKVANLPSIGYLAGDKVEGVALLPDGRIAILNDNDFGLQAEPIASDGTVAIDPMPVPIVLGIVEPDGFQGLDASDSDGAIDIASWPVYGMYMPDTIASFEVSGHGYYITANEGDARNADTRTANLILDPDAFPDAAMLQLPENLGRLDTSEIDGDIDGDGDQDRIQSYGARSFSIWDTYGNQVWDSGEEIEQITASLYPADFNSTNDENGSFDNRSDNKGPEPEAVTTGVVDGVTYAFVGLERIGGIMVYDVTDPTSPRFVQYRLDRDFSGDAALGTAGDLGPEGVIFVAGIDSPTGVPLLVVASEISGSTTIYSVEPLIASEFVRGDGNGDGAIDVADPVYNLAYQFQGGAAGCLDALDTNGDGAVDLGDPIHNLNYLFALGSAPPPPFPACGVAAPGSTLGCLGAPACP